MVSLLSNWVEQREAEFCVMLTFRYMLPDFLRRNIAVNRIGNKKPKTYDGKSTIYERNIAPPHSFLKYVKIALYFKPRYYLVSFRTDFLKTNWWCTIESSWLYFTCCFCHWIRWKWITHYPIRFILTILWWYSASYCSATAYMIASTSSSFSFLEQSSCFTVSDIKIAKWQSGLQNGPLIKEPHGVPNISSFQIILWFHVSETWW